MHGEDAPRENLPVLPDAEVPRLDPHHVIEHELQVQSALHAHLRHGTQNPDMQGQGHTTKARVALCKSVPLRSME